MNGHDISKIIFGHPVDIEANEGNDHGEEKDGRADHEGAQRELWPGRKPDEVDPIAAETVKNE